jgi:hypothetical protein
MVDTTAVCFYLNQHAPMNIVYHTGWHHPPANDGLISYHNDGQV